MCRTGFPRLLSWTLLCWTAQSANPYNCCIQSANPYNCCIHSLPTPRTAVFSLPTPTTAVFSLSATTTAVSCFFLILLLSHRRINMAPATLPYAKIEALKECFFSWLDYASTVFFYTCFTKKMYTIAKGFKDKVIKV